MLAPNSAVLQLPWFMLGGLPRIKLPDGRIIDKPHREWYLHQLRWRFLLDSWEGGESYRMAIYGFDIHGMPVRNLIRHKREYPDDFDQTYAVQAGRPPGTDPANQATDDDYELRRARTPVPTFLSDAIKNHLGRIYCDKVNRHVDTAPEAIQQWWLDVDGLGQTIDEWMSQVIAPMLMIEGCLDIVVDHPPAPPGEIPVSRADDLRLKLDSVVASYILPENMVWWRLNRQRQYEECLVREIHDDGNQYWRYWNAEHWILYQQEGKPWEETRVIGDPALKRFMANLDKSTASVKSDAKPVPHQFGRVPIHRIFDQRRPRSTWVGLPRYENIAEMQREYYNRASELILSDSTQAHPILQAPKSVVNNDGNVSVGPNWLWPMVSSDDGKTWTGCSYVDPPKGAADSLRANLLDLREQVDRTAQLTKPAGTTGTGGNTVSQSGVSKSFDHDAGNKLLVQIASVLGKAETEIAHLVLLVAGDGTVNEADVAAIKINYPSEFNLYSLDELYLAVENFQTILSQAGHAPEVERELICKLIRLMLPGLDDEEYTEFDDEIEAYLEQRQGEIAQAKLEARAGMEPGQNGSSNGKPADHSPLTPDDDVTLPQVPTMSMTTT